MLNFQNPHMTEVFFDKFRGYFYSKSRSCERAEHTKRNQALLKNKGVSKPRESNYQIKLAKQTKVMQSKQVMYLIAKRANKAKQANQLNRTNQANPASQANQEIQAKLASQQVS